MAISFSNAMAIAACNAKADLLDGGSANAAAQIVVYSGTEPANVTAALSGNTVLATFPMAATAFGDAADAAPHATATAAAIPGPVTPAATGTASFARVQDKDGADHIQLTATITGGGGQIQLSTLSLDTSVPVSITSFTLTELEYA